MSSEESTTSTDKTLFYLAPILVLVALVFWFFPSQEESQEKPAMDEFSTLIRIDPIPQTQSLVDQKKFAEANDYLSYFYDEDYVNQDPKAIEIHDQIKNTRADWLYKLKKANEGFWHGESDETEGQIAALASDFLVIGDLRDLSKEAKNYLDDKEVDKLTAALSAGGLIATAATLPSAGGSVAAKPVFSLLKMAKKVNKMPKWLAKTLIKAHEVKNLDSLKDTFKTISDLKDKAGLRATFDILSHSNDLEHFNKLANFGRAFGNKTSNLLKIGGNRVIDVYETLGGEASKDVLLKMSQFGEKGIQAVEKQGVRKAKKFLNKKNFSELTDQQHRQKLKNAMGNICKKGEQAHHILPVNVVKRLVESVAVCSDILEPASHLYVNGAKNGVCLPDASNAESAHHSGSHSKYDEQMEGLLNSKSSDKCELLEDVISCARDSLLNSTNAGLSVNNSSISCKI